MVSETFYNKINLPLSCGTMVTDITVFCFYVCNPRLWGHVSITFTYSEVGLVDHIETLMYVEACFY